MAKLESGYCYVLTGSKNWSSCHDDSWDIDTCSSLTGEKLGERVIDGAHCVVLRCEDGIVRAQMRQNVGK